MNWFTILNIILVVVLLINNFILYILRRKVRWLIMQIELDYKDRLKPIDQIVESSSDLAYLKERGFIR